MGAPHCGGPHSCYGLGLDAVGRVAMERRSTPACADRLHDDRVAASDGDPEDDAESAANARANGARGSDRWGDEQLHPLVRAEAGAGQRQRVEIDRTQRRLGRRAAHQRDADQGEKLHARHGATDPAQPCVGAGRTGYAPFMTDTPQEEQLEPDELEGTNGEPLPDREAMSTIPIGDPIGGFTVGPGPDEI